MSLGTLTDNHNLTTQEDIFLGLRLECVPPLNFQVQMEHGKPFCEAERQRINFGPLIKETPFEKEKKLKEIIKEPPPPVLPTKEVVIVEIEPPPIRKVAFCDERLPCQSLTGISSSLNRLEQNRISTSIKEVASDKSATLRSVPKGILKSKQKSKYNRQFSNQSSSQNSKSTQFTYSYSYSPKGRKLSTFSRFHELNSKHVQSESDEDYSEEDSLRSFNNHLSEENLDPLVEMYRFSGWLQQKGPPVQRKGKY